MLLLTVVAGVVCALTGCRSFVERRTVGSIPYSTQAANGAAINVKAQQENRHGIAAFNGGRLLKAEEHFRAALEEDIGFGPAHNNLGQIYLARHQLYLAAWEFEYAANLMPDLPDPFVNQGLAYETGEQIDRAIEIYRDALDRFPQNPNAIASLARALIKQDADPYEIAGLLDELIMRDGRPEWVIWAKELRQTKYRTDCQPCAGMPDAEQPYAVESDLPAYLIPAEVVDPNPQGTASPEAIPLEGAEITFPGLNESANGQATVGLLQGAAEYESIFNPIDQAGFEAFDTTGNDATSNKAQKHIGEPTVHQTDIPVRMSRRLDFNSLAKEIQESMK